MLEWVGSVAVRRERVVKRFLLEVEKTACFAIVKNISTISWTSDCTASARALPASGGIPRSITGSLAF